MLTLENSEAGTRTVKKTDRQGLTEISGEEEEEEEEDPLPVYNPQSEETGDDSPYYETTPSSDEAFIQYPLTLQ